MRWSLPCFVAFPFAFITCFLFSPAQSYSLDEIAKRQIQYTTHKIHIPIVKLDTNTIERRALFAVSGLGDFLDVYVLNLESSLRGEMLILRSVRAYTVTLVIGGIATSFILGRRLSLSSPLPKLTLTKDTGSSDLWTLSDACFSGCTNGRNKNQVRVYPQSTFRSSGLDIEMQYGDSQTGTFARGMIGNDTVDLAGMTLHNQSFAAINNTNTSVMDVGAVGILGLGFPVNR